MGPFGLTVNANRRSRPGYGQLQAPGSSYNSYDGYDSAPMAPTYRQPRQSLDDFGSLLGPTPRRNMTAPQLSAPYAPSANFNPQLAPAIQRAGEAARRQRMLNPNFNPGDPNSSEYLPSVQPVQTSSYPRIPSLIANPANDRPQTSTATLSAPYTPTPIAPTPIGIPTSMTGPLTTAGPNQMTAPSYQTYGDSTHMIPGVNPANQSAPSPKIYAPSAGMYSGQAEANMPHPTFNRQYPTQQLTQAAKDADKDAYAARNDSRDDHARTPYEREENRADLATQGYYENAAGNSEDTRQLRIENGNLRNQLQRYQTSGGGSSSATAAEIRAKQQADHDALMGDRATKGFDLKGRALDQADQQAKSKLAAETEQKTTDRRMKLFDTVDKILGEPKTAKVAVTDDKGNVTGEKTDVIGYAGFGGKHPDEARRLAIARALKVHNMKPEDVGLDASLNDTFGQEPAAPTTQQTGGAGGGGDFGAAPAATGAKQRPTPQVLDQYLQKSGGDKNKARQALINDGFDLTP